MTELRHPKPISCPVRELEREEFQVTSITINKIERERDRGREEREERETEKEVLLRIKK